MSMNKIVIDGNIVALSRNAGVKITDAEAEMIMGKASNRPTAPSGFAYHLKEDLSWELYELPPVPEDDELTAEEALEIITGGSQQ